MRMFRGGSRRGSDRGSGEGPDGWAVADGTAPRPPPRAGDLSQFGKIYKPTANASMTFGLSSVFNKKDTSKYESASLSRASNAFSLLSQGSRVVAHIEFTVSSCGQASVDLGPGGAPQVSSQRPEIHLLPPCKPVEDDSHSSSLYAVKTAEEPKTASMSEAQANKNIDEDIKEFFAVRDIDEAEDYFAKLPNQHHRLLVDKLVTRAIESK
jgi:translation initiation factor 4G